MDVGRAPDGEILASFGVPKAGLLLRISTVEERDGFRAENDVAVTSKEKLRGLIDAFLSVSTNNPRTSAGKRRARAQAAACQSGETGSKIDWALGILHLESGQLSVVSVDVAFKELAQVFHPDHGRTTDGKFMRNLNETRGLLKDHLGGKRETSDRA
jgi:hypothetical protein